MRIKHLAVAALLSALPLLAGDLTAEVQAKFVKILSAAAGSPGKVVCKDFAVMTQLVKVGVANDPSSKVAWANSTADVKAMKAAGKLVICGKLDDLQSGGAIAVVEEGGKPQIYLHMGNVTASGVTLSDSVLKIGKRL